MGGGEDEDEKEGGSREPLPRGEEEKLVEARGAQGCRRQGGHKVKDD